MKSQFRSLFKFVSTVLVGSTISLVGTISSAQAQVTSIYQLQLVARPNGQGPYCVDIDVSKIGVVQGANNAKVSPCRNIREQRFILQNTNNGMIRIQTEINVNNLNQCLATDGTKVGVINGAQNTRTEQCRNIQEINHSLSNFGNGTYGLVLQARSANGTQLCQAVDGTKIGIINGAEQVRVEGCRNIQEMQWRLVEVDRIGSNPVVSQPPSIPNTGVLPRTGGIGDYILDGLRFGYNNNYRTIINGITYTYDQYVRMRQTLSNYANATYNKGVYISRDSEGEHIAFVAHWGLYSRFTGTKAERLADKVGDYGGSLSGLFGFAVGLASANPLIGFGANVTFKHNVVTPLRDQIRTCSRTNNQVYLRFELESGSWSNSLFLLPIRGKDALNMQISASCN